MDFIFRHHNRLVYPQKHLMIVEDIISNQKRALDHFHDIFDSDGLVQISLVPGALAAACIIKNCKIDLIILDHDLPEGNGSDLLIWMKKNNINIPVITFSGIPYNNAHMGNLGATYYFFGKEDVISGKTDDLIKGILTTNPSKVESYANKLCNNFISHRWWAHPQILVGGSILDEQDYQHLKNNFNIQSVINVESEHSDLNKNIDNLLEQQVPDNGAPFTKEVVLNVVNFAESALKKGNIYVHCQMGSSRSPAFAYAILRHCFKMSPEKALNEIADLRPDPKKYGYHPYHQSYIKSIEDALEIFNESKNTGIAEYYTNTISPYNIVLPRYWINQNILIGGNIINQSDWDHLQKDFGIKAVINVDPRPNSVQIDNLLHIGVNDDGNAFPKEAILDVIKFAAKNEGPIYIHCHLGMSRSPHFAYAILRANYKMSQEDALAKVKGMLPSERHTWGFNQHTTSYIKSIEEALLEL